MKKLSDEDKEAIEELMKGVDRWVYVPEADAEGHIGIFTLGNDVVRRLPLWLCGGGDYKEVAEHILELNDERGYDHMAMIEICAHEIGEDHRPMLKLSTLSREKIEGLMGDSKWIYVPMGKDFYGSFLLVVHNLSHNEVTIIPPVICRAKSYKEMAKYSLFLNDAMGYSILKVLEIIKEIQRGLVKPTSMEFPED